MNNNLLKYINNYKINHLVINKFVKYIKINLIINNIRKNVILYLHNLN